MALDERLRRGLEDAGRPADPSGVYEELIRRREHRRLTRRATRGVLALAVLAGCVAGIVVLSRVFTASESQPAGPAGEGILFEDGSGPTSDLFIVQSDGSGMKRLTDSGDVGPGSWSPDGSQIVFPRVDGTGSADLFTMLPDGSGIRQLTDTPSLSEGVARWSPEGSKIAFEAAPENDTESVYVMDADGTNLHRLTSDPVRATDPDWSPDGSQIVFSAFDVTGDPELAAQQIWVMNADGTDQHRLITGDPAVDAGGNYGPRWSPNGTTIVFTHNRDVYVTNTDGSGVQNLTPEEATDFYDRDAAWSSDGTQLVFASTRTFGESIGLFTMNPDGTNVRALVDRAMDLCCPRPDWRGSALVETEPNPTRPPDASGEDVGLGFPVCHVSSIEGQFASADERSTVYVATAVNDEGRCPQPEASLNVVVPDVDRDGKADVPFAPIECTLECRAFSAPDIDGDGTDELLVVADGGAVVGLRLYDVVTDGELAIVPVEVAEPGDPAGGFHPGELASFLLGGDAFELYTLRCGDAPAPDGPGIVATEAEARPHDAPNAAWHAHETSFVLRDDGLLHVVDTRDFIEPITDDPSGPSFGSGETLCGSNLGPIAPIP